MNAGTPIDGLSNLDALRVAPGGPLWRVSKRLGFEGPGARPVAHRILVLLLITWVPMGVLAWLQGCAIGATARGSFLLDYATYARFFVSLPLLVFADGYIGGKLRTAGLQFVHDGVVGPADFPAFDRAVARLARRRESWLAMLILVALALLGGWKFTLENAGLNGLTGWESVEFTAGRVRESLAGLWYHTVALPVALFLLYRWFWRVLIWALFLRDVSRMNLALSAAHADGAGGLHFLESAHAGFAPLVFAINSVPAAEAAFRMVYQGAHLGSFEVQIVVLIVIAEVISLGPLLLFSPVLVRAKRDGLQRYGSLVNRYNRGFERKWISGEEAGAEPLLGSADVQSLADMGNSFRFVSDMGSTVFGRRTVLRLAAAAALPFAPLLLLEMPFAEILNATAKMLL